jgi:dihydroorotate dehydrogenase electron transfer subunit
MLWLPEIGEFPMSIALTHYGNTSIVVKAMGEGSRALYNAKVGELLGIRGPYGRNFVIADDSERLLLVCGGTGIAPILKLVQKLAAHPRAKKIAAVIAAKTKNELAFLHYLKKQLGEENIFPTTDDGTEGFKGFAHEQVRVLVQKNEFDAVYCCGPEAMMLRVHEISTKNQIPAQFSLERIMKCGIAICGSCCIQDIVLCRDGPVLNSEMLESLSAEFGKQERDKTGALIPK